MTTPANPLGQAMREAFTPKRAVSYLRVSTRSQSERGGGDDEGFSIPAQREGNRRKATALGAFIVKEFTDKGASAKSADRDKLHKMLEYIAENKVDYVIVNKIDRLARNRADDVDITRAIKESGATLVSASEDIDGESPHNLLLHGIMASIAEFYSRNLATEVMKGMSQKVKGGGTPGMAPIGYLNVQDKDELGREVRYVTVDEERAPLIRLAFEQYATGDWSVADLADYLASRGLTSRATPRKPARPIDGKMLYAVLANPYYKGIVTYKGAQYAGRHKPLVDDATWQRAQDVLASHRNGERTRIHNHFLKGLLYCGTCGKRLIVHNAKSGSGVYYPYFVCVSKHSKRGDERCTQRAVMIDEVERQVEGLYGHISLTAKYRKLLEGWLLAEIENMTQASTSEIANLEKQKKKLKSEEAKLLQAHYAEAVSLELLKSEQQRISKTLTDIETRLNRLTANIGAMRDGLMQVLDLVEDCGQTYKLAGEHEKRLMNQAVFEKITVNGDGTVTPAYAEIVGLLIAPRLQSALKVAATACLGERTPETSTGLSHTETADNGHGKPEKRKEPAANAGNGFLQSLSDTVTSAHNFFDQSLRKAVLVGVRGLEPPTSASQTRRANPTAPHPEMVSINFITSATLNTTEQTDCPHISISDKICQYGRDDLT